MATENEISPDFPFESNFVEVHGSKMHYVDEGEGDPVLFLHGNPTSSYLWRNVIPYVTGSRQTGSARAVAPDLIGMGRSDKPKIPYRFFDHVYYLEGFIEALELENVTLVLHDWGSALGFHYAYRHPDNVKALAFMEAILQPVSWSHFPKKFKIGFKLFRTPVAGWMMISVMNAFLRQILPQTIVRPLTDAEQASYEAPYPTIASRRPVRQWPCEIPIDGKPRDVHEAVAAYSRWLQETDLPKLFCYARPGALCTRPTVEWVQESFQNLTAIDVGKGLHFIQEDNPHGIGEALADWYRGL